MSTPKPYRQRKYASSEPNVPNTKTIPPKTYSLPTIVAKRFSDVNSGTSSSNISYIFAAIYYN
jgi:hypothetical protein